MLFVQTVYTAGSFSHACGRGGGVNENICAAISPGNVPTYVAGSNRGNYLNFSEYVYD